MTKEEFIALYEKCLSGKCTNDELHLLEQYQDDYELTKRPWISEMGIKEEVRDQIIANLRAKIQPSVRKTNYLYSRWAIAASVIVLLSAGILFLTMPEKEIPQIDHSAKTHVPNAPILPGGNKAILTLANGEKIDLNSSGKGLLSQQGNAAVSKLSDGALAYNAGSATNKQAAVAYNTITTPRGGQYQLTLADGTKVWLNAASSLTYPTLFPGKERIVELTGEAYFEVAKNKAKPFKVMVNGTSINVLGTHFNVMSYPDENSIQTTLLEGSVKLAKNGHEAMLVPGQQGVLQNGTSDFNIHEVNVNDVVSWKNGLFIFDNENIHTIMRKVARWYDIDIEYNGKLIEQSFGGSVPRFKDISYLLKTLELTGTIHFKIEGRRIIVMP